MSKDKKYLMKECDSAITELVIERKSLYKAYNYYHGILDKKQYEAYEKGYGVENPTSVEFVPLTRKHIDAIVGEYLTQKLQPKISCKDSKTLSNIYRDKQLEIEDRIHKLAISKLENHIYRTIMGKDPQDPVQDEVIDKELKDVEDSVNRNYVSNYEMAAQTIVQYAINSRDIDLKNQLTELLTDLLVGGEGHYKVVKTKSGNGFRLEVSDPLNTFIERDPKSKYIKNGYRDVVRKWMTKREIIMKYGKYLSQDDRDKINEQMHHRYNDATLLAAINGRIGVNLSDGLWDTYTGGFDNTHEEVSDIVRDLIPVYEVEWIDTEGEGDDTKAYRYNVTRIGENIYILFGRDDEMVRSIDEPNEARLALNGLYFTDRTGIPYSLILATASLQDKFNLLNYLRDNYIALSGVKGAHVDVAQLPTELGTGFDERLIKYWGWRKLGISLMNSAQEGGENMNTLVNGFDDTLSLNAIQAIDLAIERVEMTCSSITGVFRERLGGIQQRDAVANVEKGMQQSYVITKPYFQAMDTVTSEVLTDCIDIAKIVYKKGLKGEFVLGNQKHYLDVLPEHYTSTSYDVHVTDTADLIEQQDLLKQVAIQLSQSSQVDPELLVIVTTSKSTTEMKDAVMEAIRQKKLENNQIQQLSQALEEAQKQQQQLQKQLNQAINKLGQLNEQKLKIDEYEVTESLAIKRFDAEQNARLKEEENQLIRERNQLERLQLVDSNPNNDAINNRKK